MADDTQGQAMPVLYDATTRKPDPIDDPELLHQAILSGTHSFPAGALLPGKNTEGKTVNIPSENAAEAIKAGYSILTPSQKVIEEYTSQPQNQGLAGDLKVGALQALNQVGFDIPQMIYEKKASPLDVAKWEALKKEHDFANTVGGVGGWGASLLTGAPLFEAAGKAGAKATEAIASRIGVGAGEEVTKRSVTEIAKKIAANSVAKVGGSAVEGAMIAAPHAITEAALGDPDDAAESLMAGGLIGGALGAGGGLTKGLFNLAKELPTALEGQALTAQGIMRKVVSVATKVPEKSLQDFSGNIDRINSSPELGDIKDVLDSAVNKHADYVRIHTQNVSNIERDLSEAYSGAKADLQNTRPPAAVADDITGALENQKSVLGDLSAKADDILGGLDGTIEKQHLESFITKLGKSIGIGPKNTLVGDEYQKAVASLFKIKESMVTLPEELSYPEVRELLQQVRADIKFNPNAGEFNDTKNYLLKKFTGGISDVLKEKSPEYAQLMSQMADMSQNLADMSKSFGTREKALGTLNSIFKPRGLVKNEALQKLSDITGVDYFAKLQDYKKAQDLLSQTTNGRSISDKLLPEMTQKLQDAKSAQAIAENNFQKISKLTPDRTQSIIKNQGGTAASIENKKALEALGELEGKDFLQMINDTNTRESFKKGYSEGSRKTNLFGILGGSAGALLGGPVGGAIGAGLGGSLGATLDVYGGQIVKKMIEANQSKAGLLFVEQAYKKTAEKLDAIPKALDRMSSVTKATPGQIGTLGLFKLLHGDAHKDLPTHDTVPVKDRVKALDKLREKTSTLVGNPGGMINTVSAMSSPISQLGAPNIGAAFSGKMNQAISYIDQSMPKPPRPSSPFAPKADWKPSDFELAAYEQKMQVVHDPFSVIKELEHGTLTKNHMNALKNVYPGIHRMIQDRVQKTVIDGHAKPLPYASRVKLSLLMEAPMDTSLRPEGIQYYQSYFQGAQPSEDQGGAEQASNTFKGKVELAQNLATDTDRRESRQKT